MTATKKSVKRLNVDFLACHRESNAIQLEKSSLSQGLFFDSVAVFEDFNQDMPIKFYAINNDRYAYFSSGKVRKLGWGYYLWESVNTYSNMPIIKQTLYNGAVKTIVAYDKTAEIVGEGKITIPSSITVNFVVCNNVMFTAKQNQLFFSQPFDPLGIDFTLETSNVINLDNSLGNVMGLHCSDKKILVVCKYGLVTISVDGAKQDYVVKRLDGVNLNVLASSVVGLGTSVYFVSNNKVCAFDGNKLKTFDLPNKTMSIQGYSAVYENYYLFPVAFIPEYKMVTIAVNVETGNIQYLDWVVGISETGGVASSGSDLLMIRNSPTERVVYGSYSSCEIDMDTAKRKRLLGVQAKSKGKITLNVHGEFGTAKVYLNGLTDYKCNLVSNEFSFDFSARGDCLPLENLKFIYQEKEN